MTFLCFLLCVLVSGSAVAQEESAALFLKTVNDNRDTSGLVYDMTVQNEDGMLAYHTFSQNGKWRMDGESDKQTTRILFDGQKTIVVIDNTALEQNISHFGVMPSETDMINYTLGSKTTRNGYPCRTVYNTSEKLEMCIYEKYALPVYVKTTDFTMTVKNIVSEKLPDKTFELPSNVTLLNLKDMQ